MRVVSYTITVGAPGVLNGNEGRRELALFYCELLDMRIVREDWLKIATDPDALPQIAFDPDGWSDERPPRWGDPEFPQQLHIDISVADLETADRVVRKRGGTLLHDQGAFRSYADPAGHPFCLYPDDVNETTKAPRILRLMFDCFSPRSLASFYEQMLAPAPRVEDSPERVVIAPDGLPMFGFQHAEFVAPRWPDDRYPAQLHLDLNFDDRAPFEVVESLGAIRLHRPDGTEGTNGLGRPMRAYGDPAGHPFCVGSYA